MEQSLYLEKELLPDILIGACLPQRSYMATCTFTGSAKSFLGHGIEVTLSSPFSTKILLSAGDLTACRFYRANVPHDTCTYSLVDIIFLVAFSLMEQSLCLEKELVLAIPIDAFHNDLNVMATCTFTGSAKSFLGDGIDVGNIVVAVFHKNFVVDRRLDCVSLL